MGITFAQDHCTSSMVRWLRSSGGCALRALLRNSGAPYAPGPRWVAGPVEGNARAAGAGALALRCGLAASPGVAAPRVLVEGAKGSFGLAIVVVRWRLPGMRR
jgi:hypothetical protein